MPKYIINGETVTGTAEEATNIKLDSIDGMSAANVQDGISELKDKLTTKQDLVSLVASGTISSTNSISFTMKPSYKFALVIARASAETTSSRAQIVITQGGTVLARNIGLEGDFVSCFYTLGSVESDTDFVISFSNVTSDSTYNMYSVIAF